MDQRFEEQFLKDHGLKKGSRFIVSRDSTIKNNGTYSVISVSERLRGGHKIRARHSISGIMVRFSPDEIEFWRKSSGHT